jgi:gluconate 2-dehydrogenase gamma chain
MKHERDNPSASRRQLVKGLSLIPVVVATLGGAVTAGSSYAAAATDSGSRDFILAACDRLIPHDDIGPGAVELGVPEFLDRHMQTPYASGEIWYMQGPFLEASEKFGYQGRLSLRDILRLGMQAVDRSCASTHDGKLFTQLTHAEQEAVLKAAERVS